MALSYEEWLKKEGRAGQVQGSGPAGTEGTGATIAKRDYQTYLNTVDNANKDKNDIIDTIEGGGGSEDPTGGPGKGQSNAEKRLVRLAKTPEEVASIKRQTIARAHRDVDWDRGAARGQELFSEGSLGRQLQARSPEEAAVLARRMSYSQGMSSPEYQALREQRQAQVQSSNQGQMRSLRGAQAGMGGPLAAAQQLRLQKQQSLADRANSRELMLADMGMKRQGLGDYETSLSNITAGERDRERYNIGQGGREKLGQLTTILSEMGLSSAERLGGMNLEAASKYADAASKQGGGKK